MLCNAYDDMSSFNARSKHRGVTVPLVTMRVNYDTVEALRLTMSVK